MRRDNFPILTEINEVGAKKLETLITSLLTILRRAINLEARTSFEEPKLSAKKDLVTFPGTLEPLPHKFLSITV